MSNGSAEEFSALVDQWFEATVGETAAARKVKLESCPPEVRARVEHLLELLESASLFEPEGPVDLSTEDPAASERVGNYRILERIGSGGMGSVYRACRVDDYEQIVALKLLKTGMATADFARRFRTERQLLARLEHPYITRLLDGGSTSEGAPFLVMEFVDGRPVTQHCDEERLGIEPRLELYLRICQAVAFAHRNLILHRDLKPGNILVNRQGEPKLLDFGIAKVLDAERDAGVATSANVRVMTPQFASPEQVRGEALTMASDVYSLGMLLHRLLTGQLPYTVPSNASPFVLYQVVCEREPERPSQAALCASPEQLAALQAASPKRLARALKGDLDAIVLKALRKEPGLRYPTVDALDEDVRRFLAHEPVLARSGSRTYAARKFVRRHRVLVVTSGVVGTALLLAIAGLTVGLREARAANRLEQDANRHAQSLTDVIELLIGEIRAQRRGLGGERLRASRLAQLHDVLKRLEQLPSDETRPLLMVDAYQEVGAMELEVGNADAADVSLAKACEMSRALHAQRSSDLLCAHRLSSSLVQRGDLRKQRGFLAEALSMYEEALAIDRGVAAQAGDDPTLTQQLSVSLERVANLTAELKGFEHSADLYRELVDVARKWLARFPEDVPAKQQLATALRKRAQLESASGNPEKAAADLQESLELFVSVGSREPDNAQARVDLALAERKIGDQRLSQGRIDDAIARFEQARARLEQSVADDPRNVELRRELATTYYWIGTARKQQGHLDAAAQDLERAVEIRRALRKEDPQNQDVARDLVTVAMELSLLFSAIDGRAQSAASLLEEVMTLSGELYGANPESSVDRAGVALASLLLAEARQRLGELEAAEQAAVDAAEHTRALLAKDDNAYHQNLHIGALNLLGAIRRDRGDASGAKEVLSQAVELQRKLLLQSDVGSDARFSLASSVYYLGTAEQSLGNLEAALVALEEAAAITEELRSIDPSNLAPLQVLANAMRAVGEVLLELGRTAEARTALRVARDHYRVLVPGSPHDRMGLEKVERLLETLPK